MQTSFQQSSDAGEARIPPLYPTALLSLETSFPSLSPSLPIALHSLHQPRLSAALGIGLPDPPEPIEPHLDLEYPPSEPRRPEAFRACPQRCGACALSLSSRHRTRKSPLFCRLDALTIDNRGARTLLAALSGSHSVSQLVVDPFQSAVIAPLLEVHVDSGVRREIVREHAPSAAASQDVEDGIDYCPQVGSTRPSSRLAPRQKARNHPPFRVVQIAWVSHDDILARLPGLPKHPLRCKNHPSPDFSL